VKTEGSSKEKLEKYIILSIQLDLLLGKRICSKDQGLCDVSIVKDDEIEKSTSDMYSLDN
jgi:hypothetical protein